MSLAVAKCKQLNQLFMEEWACYECWTLSELKAELCRRKARLSGMKSELVERFVFVCHLAFAVDDKCVSLSTPTPPCRVGLRMNYQWPRREVTL